MKNKEKNLSCKCDLLLFITFASAQTNQSLCCPHETTLRHWLSKLGPKKILIRLRECAGDLNFHSAHMPEGSSQLSWLVFISFYGLCYNDTLLNQMSVRIETTTNASARLVSYNLSPSEVLLHQTLVFFCPQAPVNSPRFSSKCSFYFSFSFGSMVLLWYLWESNSGAADAGGRIITKTRLFKYTENFTTKNENFQIKILIFFIFLLKT